VLTFRSLLSGPHPGQEPERGCAQAVVDGDEDDGVGDHTSQGGELPHLDLLPDAEPLRASNEEEADEEEDEEELAAGQQQAPVGVHNSASG
jgi:hypothetical protein